MADATGGAFFTTYFCMCDVSVAWKEGQGLITEVTSSMGKVRAWWVSVARSGAICRDQHLLSMKALSPIATQSTLSQAVVGDFPTSTLGIEVMFSLQKVPGQHRNQNPHYDYTDDHGPCQVLRQETPDQGGKSQKPNTAHRRTCGVHTCSFLSPLSSL